MRTRVSEGVAGRAQLLPRASALGVEAGSCITLWSPPIRAGHPWLLPSNHDNQSSISSRERRDANAAVPRLRTPTASVERTSTTIHIARQHISLGVVGRESSCSRRNCNQGGVGQPEPVTP